MNPNQTGRAGCIVEGCTCKDARVLNYRHLRFIKALAESRGETLDRVVPAGDLSALLVRPNEPENIESEETPRPKVDMSRSVLQRRKGGLLSLSSSPTCGCPDCDGRCSNVRTLTHPVRCSDCTSGIHLGAA